MTGGTGLGLYSLAKRVEALGGACGVASRKDGKEGSMFYYTFPYRPDEEAAKDELRERLLRIDSNPMEEKDEGDLAPAIEDAGVEVFPESVAMTKTDTTATTAPAKTATDAASGPIGTVPSTMSLLQQKLDDAMASRGSNSVSKSGKMGDPLAVVGNSKSLGMSKENPQDGATMAPQTGKKSNAELGAVAAAESQNLNGVKILLVDDTASILKVAGRLLRMNGHHVDTASNGSKGLEALKAAWETDGFDLELSDLQMPVSSEFCLTYA
jgi:hypothetical protein